MEKDCIIKTHIEISNKIDDFIEYKRLTKRDAVKFKSIMDDIFCYQVSKNDYNDFRDRNKIDGMNISPYYGMEK